MHPILVLFSIAILPVLVLLLVSTNHKPYHNGHPLPPAPWPRLPLIGNIFWYSPNIASLTAVLGRLHNSHGPVVSLWVGNKPAVFLDCHEITHKALTQMGTIFAHRPTSWFEGVNSHGINSTTYCGRWSLLRRNLSSHLAAVQHATDALRSSIDGLVKNLESAVAGTEGGVIAPSEPFRHAMFSFFSALCYGKQVDEDVLASLRDLHAEIISLIVELDAFHLMPALLKLVYYLPKWRKLLSAQRRHHVLVTALISACRKQPEKVAGCYVHTLLGLGLGEDEMVSLCWEYMNASVKTTTTALDWIMARLVLHQDIQQKLRMDIAERPSGNLVPCCEPRPRRPFLEAVVVEALRLHPPAHYLLAHTTDKDVILDKYAIPKGSIVNINLANIGRDATLWTDPNVFMPERFMEGGEGSNVNCISGAQTTTKMLPFGAGRRACPGAAIALTVLQSFVEELVKWFQWEPLERGLMEEPSIDMIEKQGIVTEMRIPLRTRLVVRQH
ncbi:hypothetical protein PR202_gb24814 [Eleusine coracana subsp. coracana]|uniref:Cytochrome P450 n=1 Tax=Eleusine coracana subsp. coracana TaxID=191504 RepID=A0AAV5FMI9_ELECO|nr:hypothetical protein PR202_gb24814 [Eleusine coracana subsp. coracana]